MLVECGFEQCLVDPCVFRPMVNDEVVVMVVVHVDDIKIAATKEIPDLVLADLNKRFPMKQLGGVTWYMGSGYKKESGEGYAGDCAGSVYPKCHRTFRYPPNEPHSCFTVVGPQARK
ncbi:unnamed protein product [Scytosiphon promiscuus]